MNILLITSDQQRWDTIGANNPAIRTPNLDRLAARGIVFDRAYTCNPVCTPARCSILTGQYPSRHGCFHVGTNLPGDYPTSVAADLSAAGYFTAILGKSHFQAEFAKLESTELKPHLLDFDRYRAWSGPHYGFERAKINVGHTSEAVGCSQHYGVWLLDRGVPLERYFGIHDYAHFGRWELPENVSSSAWVAEETMAAIDEAAAWSRPFFCWANFPDPHNPYVVSEPWDTLHRPEDMPPALPPVSPADKPPFYAALEANAGYGDDPDLQERAWGDCRRQPEMTPARTAELRAVYHGMVSQMDHHIGRILDHLEAAGQLDQTVIVFHSDHGDYLGDCGLWGKGLPAYDSVQRVPFIVSHPDCRTPGARSVAYQSPVDLRSTFRTIAGIAGPAPDDQGIAQTDSWVDAGRTNRPFAKLEFRPSQGAYFQNTFVFEEAGAAHKLVIYRDREYGELYNLDADPHQATNLWDMPAFRSVRERLVERFTQEIVRPEDEVVRQRMAYA